MGEMMDLSFLITATIVGVILTTYVRITTAIIEHFENNRNSDLNQHEVFQ